MASTHSKISFSLLSLCLFSFIAGAWASDTPIITNDLQHADPVSRLHDEATSMFEASLVRHGKTKRPHKSSLSPAASSPSVCDEFKSCPAKSTCCCVYESSGSCHAWGCCAFEGGTCCKDRNTCCPREFPVCNVSAGTCSASKKNPLGVMAMKRILAKPVESFGKKGKTSGD